LRYWVALCLCLPLFGLELTLQSGKEEGRKYSILHLRHSTPFVCTPTNDEFGETRRVDCYFSKPPKENFSPIDNTHLSIKSSQSAKGYVITILPKKKMKAIPIRFKLSKEAQTFRSDAPKSIHWNILGYDKVPPLLDSPADSPKAINFPIKMAQHKTPYVGGLDLKGNPIKIRRVQDVTDYMEMKKAYASGDYHKVLERAGSALKEYPNTVFKNELVLYTIRAYHHMGEFEKLLEMSKTFTREYAGDPNIAEVLAYTANAYSKVGQITDADYYYERLFDEHPQSPFASVGMLYKAEQSETGGDGRKAKFFYQKALASTSDIGVASKAAFKLAGIELREGETKKAAEYVDKITRVNPKYFHEVSEYAVAMAEEFAERKDPKTAARITEALLNESEKKGDKHQLLLKNLGLQLAKAGRRTEALKRFNEYLESYKNGEYAPEIRRAKDGLFFEEGDKNATQEIQKYDDLIERYGNDSVGRKALYKKAQLLLEEKKYKEVLDIENDLYKLDTTEYPQTTSIIAKSAIGLTKSYLSQGKCTEAMKLQKMYKVKLLPQWDESLFTCALKTTNYPTAKKIAERHLKSPSIQERQVWLLRMVKTQFALGEYKAAIKGGNELITLLQSEKNPPLNEIYRIMFDAAQRVGEAESMIRHIKAIESAFPNDFKDIERYTQMVSLGLKRKDEAMTQNYAKKVIALQVRTKTYTQSPYIEFTLAQSYQNVSKDKEALEVLKTLNARKLSNERRSRQYYLIGALEQKLGNKRQARDAFNASIKADKNSAWGKLAKDALALL
jgi:tetratricopeptide (TPR) repeat protein